MDKAAASFLDTLKSRFGLDELGKFYYVGADFPDYVPIVTYNEYEPAVKCPEIAYIHNPYDQFMSVRSTQDGIPTS